MNIIKREWIRSRVWVKGVLVLIDGGGYGRRDRVYRGCVYLVRRESYELFTVEFL